MIFRIDTVRPNDGRHVLPAVHQSNILDPRSCCFARAHHLFATQSHGMHNILSDHNKCCSTLFSRPCAHRRRPKYKVQFFVHFLCVDFVLVYRKLAPNSPVEFDDLMLPLLTSFHSQIFRMVHSMLTDCLTSNLVNEQQRKKLKFSNFGATIK